MYRIILLLAVLAAPLPADAQTLRGRVIADDTRQALAETTVHLLRGDAAIAETATDAQGFYTFALPDTGAFRVRITRAGYAEVIQTVRASRPGADVTVPAAVMKQEAIRMETLEVTGEQAELAMHAGFPVARPMNRLAGERLAKLEKMGISTQSALRELGAGLRVRTYTPRGRPPETCVETTRRTMTFSGGTGTGACENVALIMDGIYIGEASHNVTRSLRVSDFESIEFLSPLEAGQRWGFEASARGALVIWTRGNGPHRSEARKPDH
ncbi:MAG TPA: carboxypeptidase-like regulatory domain-containing protein [Longimicrobiales bacterium]|nr:carboxypeptidase-like regulatory domain-containing protein [Longimicrobiales bacterium]